MAATTEPYFWLFSNLTLFGSRSNPFEATTEPDFWLFSNLTLFGARRNPFEATTEPYFWLFSNLTLFGSRSNPFEATTESDFWLFSNLTLFGARSNPFEETLLILCLIKLIDSLNRLQYFCFSWSFYSIAQSYFLLYLSLPSASNGRILTIELTGDRIAWSFKQDFVPRNFWET